jgi:putative membrane protein
MIQESKILQWFKRRKAVNSWIIVLLTQPKLYLYNLLKRTAMTGLFMFLFYETIQYIGVTKQAIPSNLHSLIGIVIGLLLVFRTNTAYDRWWEARKIFASLHAIILYLRQKTVKMDKKMEVLYHLRKINTSMFEFVSTNDAKESAAYKETFISSHNTLSEIIFCEFNESPIFGNVEKKLSEILDQFCSLERIKNTPIPISYTFHIKLSVFIYLLSLPFGLFFELGVVAIPFVMILFFIIGGIEIISTEIENPFRGDPNDLPIDEYRSDNEKYLL